MLQGFANLASHTVYVPGVRAQGAIVDFGANRGAFHDALRPYAVEANFYAVEANPSLIGDLSHRCTTVDPGATSAFWQPLRR